MIPHNLKWKPVPSHPRISVTRRGDLKVDGVHRRASWCNHTTGWVITLRLYGYSTNLRIARLVGEVWSKDFAPDKVPVFRDGDRRNVHVTNLKWVARNAVTVNPYTYKPRPEKKQNPS